MWAEAQCGSGLTTVELRPGQEREGCLKPVEKKKDDMERLILDTNPSEVGGHIITTVYPG